MPTKNKILQSDVLNTKGDLLGRSSSADAVIPIGADSQVLTADSTQTLGLKWGYIPRLLYANTSIPAGNTVANTAADTNFTSKYTLAANALSVGQVIRFTASGTYGTALLVAPTITLSVKFGSTVVASGSQTLILNLANKGWSLDAQFIVFATGSSGTIEGQGDFSFDTAVTKTVNTSSITVNTTVSNDLQISANWSAANSNNTITLRQLIIEFLG